MPNITMEKKITTNFKKGDYVSDGSTYYVFDSYTEDKQLSNVFGIELNELKESTIVIQKTIDTSMLQRGSEYMVNEIGNLANLRKQVLDGREFITFSE